MTWLFTKDWITISSVNSSANMFRIVNSGPSKIMGNSTQKCERFVDQIFKGLGRCFVDGWVWVYGWFCASLLSRAGFELVSPGS